MKRADPVTLEILRHAFTSLVEEMGIIVQRTAYSLNVREREDYSAALCDAEGNLVSQAQRIPMHIGGMSAAVRNLLNRITREKMKRGDIYISNDPYGGGQHTPDIQLIMPVFFRGTVVAFVTTIAHHIDVGGSSSSAMDPSAKEVFQEGLLFPGVRLYARGKPVTDLFEFIAANVRYSALTLGDLRSQAAAVRTGGDRFLEIIGRYGLRTVVDGLKEFQAISEYQMRRCIAKIPDGTYCFKDYIDSDGVSDEICEISVAVTIKDTDIIVDFTGTSEQRPGAVNSGPTATASAVYFAIRTFADRDVLLTDGCFKPVRIIAPAGCMVNPIYPAACGARITIAHRIVDVIFGAMASVVPERVETASYGTSPCYQFVGRRSDNGKSFILFDANHGSSGARFGLDGNDGCTDKISNAKNLSIEVCEAQLPCLFENYEFVQDSGGAGESRGGLAVRRSIRILADCSVQIIADREKIAPYGLDGGHPGQAAECVINPGTGKERRLNVKSSTTLQAGDVFSFTTPGAGGFGMPCRRPEKLICRDLDNEMISVRAAKDIYGYVKNADVDTQAVR